jgi:hypothetical protein
MRKKTNNFFESLSKQDVSNLISIKKASIVFKRNLKLRSRRSIRFLGRKIKMFYEDEL